MPESYGVRAKFRFVLHEIDWHMSRTRNAHLAWNAAAVALGLPSAKGKSLSELAAELSVTKQALSKYVTRFLN